MNNNPREPLKPLLCISFAVKVVLVVVLAKSLMGAAICEP
jgi:hypothetical protein